MPKDEKETSRKRMVVEEVGATESAPVEEIKEKVEELQEITEGMSQSVEKSAEIQEELAEVVEKVSPTPVAEVIPNPVGPSPFLVIVPGVLLLGALLGGIIFYKNGVGKKEDTSPAPTDLSATAVPTASVVPTSVDLTKYSIAVFNGSGVTGEAKKVKDMLETSEFKVSGTANAATADYTKTIVKAKSTVDAGYVSKLVEILGKTYVVDKTQILSDSSTDEVQVIVGTSKK